jgi:hypothetical protein
MDAAELLALALVLDEADVAGAELLLLLLELLLQAATSNAVAAAAAVSPARADTEYNGVPRLFSRDMPQACERPDPYGPVSMDRGTSGEIVRLR